MQGMVSLPRVQVDIDAIPGNYATKYTTKMKAKFSYCDQIKLNGHTWHLCVFSYMGDDYAMQCL